MPPPSLSGAPLFDAPTPHTSSPSAAMLAEAFELGRPIEPLAPYCFGSHENWTLGTMAGRFLVTRLWAGPDAPWRPELERAMEFERRACQAGIDMPRPIAPRTAAFGDAARVHGFGVFRIHEWVDHRPLGVDDDIAAWLGSTLARLHRLVPLDAPPQPRWYGLFPAAALERLARRGRGARHGVGAGAAGTAARHPRGLPLDRGRVREGRPLRRHAPRRPAVRTC